MTLFYFCIYAFFYWQKNNKPMRFQYKNASFRLADKTLEKIRKRKVQSDKSYNLFFLNLLEARTGSTNKQAAMNGKKNP
jgi:hypothetical protein